MRNDYPVDFRTAQSIKGIAERSRNLLEVTDRPDFRVIDGIRRLCREPLLVGGLLELRKFRATPTDAPAFVTFKPSVVLNVDVDLLEEAEENYPWAREVMSHELGHILLHEHYVPQFSGIKKKWIAIEERSGEWQAHKFSEFYLVRDCDILNYITPNGIANHCAVEYSLAFRRLGRKFAFSGESCPNCGDLRLVQYRNSFICDNCTYECSFI